MLGRDGICKLLAIVEWLKEGLKAFVDGRHVVVVVTLWRTWVIEAVSLRGKPSLLVMPAVQESIY